MHTRMLLFSIGLEICNPKGYASQILVGSLPRFHFSIQLWWLVSDECKGSILWGESLFLHQRLNPIKEQGADWNLFVEFCMNCSRAARI